MNLTGYLGNTLLKPIGAPLDFTEHELDEYIKCKKDPIYFIRTYCKIVTSDYGLIVFPLFDYQIRFIMAMHERRMVIGMFGRQMGKTTCAAAYLLWFSIFNDAKTSAILANKAAAAREVMARYQMMFEYLPKFLQQGVKTWNKGDIELENGSKVFTGATSASGIRGKTCVSGSTKVCIRDKQGFIFYAAIDELLSGLGREHLVGTNSEVVEQFGPEKVRLIVEEYPTEYPKIKIGQSLSEFEILSEDKFRRVEELLFQGVRYTLVVRFASGNSITVTPDHKLLTSIGWKTAANLSVGDKLSDEMISSVDCGNSIPVYDFFNVDEKHSYYTNGVISHNCQLLYIDEAAIIPNSVADQFFTSTYPTISSGKTAKIVMTSTPLGYNHFWKFWNEAETGMNDFYPVRVRWQEHPTRDDEWAAGQLRLLGELKYNQEVECAFLGSSSTLINANAMGKMSAIAPLLKREDGLDVYEFPIKGDAPHSYVISVDTSKGVGGDYSVFNCIDVTTFPYKVVAKYRNNKIAPLLFPSVIYQIANDYNEALVIFETNCSEQVPHIVYYELEYTNIVFVSQTPKGQVVSGGFGNNVRLGVNMDKRIKRIGCSNFKSMVEEGKLITFDADTIAEISTFIQVRDTYAADDGYHDDLVMSLVIFAWLTTQPYFVEMTNLNMRQALYQSRIDAIESEHIPIGNFTNGVDSPEPETFNF